MISPSLNSKYYLKEKKQHLTHIIYAYIILNQKFCPILLSSWINCQYRVSGNLKSVYLSTILWWEFSFLAHKFCKCKWLQVKFNLNFILQLLNIKEKNHQWTCKISTTAILTFLKFVFPFYLFLVNPFFNH